MAKLANMNSLVASATLPIQPRLGFGDTYDTRRMATDSRNTSQLLSNTFGRGLCPGRPLESVSELLLLPARNHRPLERDDPSTCLKERLVLTYFHRITINKTIPIAQLVTARHLVSLLGARLSVIFNGLTLHICYDHIYQEASLHYLRLK